MLFILFLDTANGAHIVSHILDISLARLIVLKVNISSVIDIVKFSMYKSVIVTSITISAITSVISTIVTFTIILHLHCILEIISIVVLILIT